MRVTVDLSRCQGYGNCVSASPSVFDLDESGLAKVLVAEPAPELHDSVRTAASMCPVAAVEIDEG